MITQQDLQAVVSQVNGILQNLEKRIKALEVAEEKPKQDPKQGKSK